MATVYKNLLVSHAEFNFARFPQKSEIKKCQNLKENIFPELYFSDNKRKLKSLFTKCIFCSSLQFKITNIPYENFEILFNFYDRKIYHFK